MLLLATWARIFCRNAGRVLARMYIEYRSHYLLRSHCLNALTNSTCNSCSLYSKRGSFFGWSRVGHFYDQNMGTSCSHNRTVSSKFSKISESQESQLHTPIPRMDDEEREMIAKYQIPAELVRLHLPRETSFSLHTPRAEPNSVAVGTTGEDSLLPQRCYCVGVEKNTSCAVRGK